MKPKTSRAAVLAALLLCAGLTHGQDTSGARPKRARAPEDYRPRKLKEVAAAGPGAEGRGDEAETVIVGGDVLPSRVRVRYAGSSRPLPPRKREVLRRWAMRFAGLPEGYTKPYETELLFAEDGAEFWLAVRRDDRLVRAGRGLKRGDESELFLIRVGAAKASGKWEPLLLIENSSAVTRD